LTVTSLDVSAYSDLTKAGTLLCVSESGHGGLEPGWEAGRN